MTANAVGIRRQVGRGVDGFCAVDGVGRAVELVEPLLPVKERRFRYPGRKRLPDRQALQGILFVLHTGISWPHLPLELGFGSGVTCWRRMDEWQKAGVWERLHELFWRGCGLLARSSGRVRSRTRVTCKRKRGLRDGPEPG